MAQGWFSSLNALPAPILLLLLHCLWAVDSSIPPHDQVAKVARFIAHSCEWGSLATLSTRAPNIGQPFSNVFSVSDGPRERGSGILYLYLTPLEISVQDLEINPTASMAMTLAETLFCRKHGYDPQSPLCCRVIFSGTVMKVNGSEEALAKDALFSRHPEMIKWPQYHRWYFAKINITNIWVLDYFGGVKTVTPEAYYSVPPLIQGEKNLDW